MTLLSKLRDLLTGPKPLRNRAGGLAYIKTFGHEHGADAIAGQVVTTVKADSSRVWAIEPNPRYVLTANITYEGRNYPAGSHARVVGIDDNLLVPLRNPGDGEQTQERSFQPPAEELIPLKVRGEVS